MSERDTRLRMLDLPQGIHVNIPPSIYHEPHLGLVSKSSLDMIHRSPAHLLAWVKGELKRESEAMAFGGAFHCALLEPERFETDYITEPTWDEYRDKRGALSTNAGKAARAEWLEVNHDKTAIAADDRTLMGAMVRAVRAHPLASKMVRDGIPEVTLRWKDAETGLPCKARTDYYVRGRKMVVDVKTSDDASYDAFRRSVVKYRYHVQDALYREAFGAIGEPIQHFVFVVVEKSPPHAVAVYTLDSEGIQRGYAHTRHDIATLAECLRNDEWPGYPVTIQTLELPPWAA